MNSQQGLTKENMSVSLYNVTAGYVALEQLQTKLWKYILQNFPPHLDSIRGLARYSVRLTATALEKLLHNFLFMLDPHP